MITTKYVGGPLDGTDAVRVGATWWRYRNAAGEWISGLPQRKRRIPWQFYVYMPEDGVYVYVPAGRRPAA